MALIIWSDSYSVGVKDIDDQHKVLIEVINKLDDASKSGQGHEALSSIYTELVNYTVFHFNHEEALMRKGGYDDFDNHRKIHKSIVEKVAVLKQQYESGSATAIQDALRFLQGWLVDHINGKDKLYTPFMHNQGIK